MRSAGDVMVDGKCVRKRKIQAKDLKIYTEKLAAYCGRVDWLDLTNTFRSSLVMAGQKSTSKKPTRSKR